jgi:hypothetical protein
MADTANPRHTLTPAQDAFEPYYTEKLWQWIPEVYKTEDGLAVQPDVLRALIEILAQQAAVARRSIDRLWEDQFIEFCDDWAVSYIGDLVGTRLVHELNRRGRRVDVARTIFYRRRKGTPLVLELLIRDITGWEGVVVESFRRLARTHHGLDPEPMAQEGLVTQTSPGGWAALRSGRGAELVDGPFDEFLHTPDFRQLKGSRGRYNIPKLNFHLFRLAPFEVRGVTAMNFGNGRWTFDPSGRDVPLFMPSQRPDPQVWRPVHEWEIPAPLPCRLLGAAQYVITADVIDTLIDVGLPQPAADELARYVGVRFHHETRLWQTLNSLDEVAAMAPEQIRQIFDTLLAHTITEDSPKAHLVPTPIQLDPSAVVVAVGPATTATDAPTIEHQRIASGNLEDWGESLGMLSPEKVLVIDPERGRFWFRSPPDDPVWVRVHHYGFSGNIGAGTYDRRRSIETAEVTPVQNDNPTNPGPVAMAVPETLPDVLQFSYSKTYLPDGDLKVDGEVTWQAANFQRPYIKRVPSSGTTWVFGAKEQTPDDAAAETDLPSLTLDGLWIGIEAPGTVPMPEPCLPVPAVIELRGQFNRVVIRHCTLDPGGEQARQQPGACQAIPYVQLVVSGTVRELVIEASIVGPIREDKTLSPQGNIQKLDIRDSVVHSIDAAQVPAITTELGQVDMQRVTVFGDVTVNRLFASEALIQGLVRVTDTQHGCFRFSATNESPQKRLPSQFESHLFKPILPNHFFVSRRFGDPGYAQLSETASPDILRGAEHGSEIGAFSSLLSPIKLDDLKAKVNEFMPFGLIAQFVNET